MNPESKVSSLDYGIVSLQAGETKNDEGRTVYLDGAQEVTFEKFLGLVVILARAEELAKIVKKQNHIIGH